MRVQYYYGKSEIIGLTHLEREIVACAVLYNTYPLEDYEALADRLDRASYMTVAKLSAILRVSNAWTAATGRNLSM